MSEHYYEVVFTFVDIDDAKKWLDDAAEGCGSDVDCRCPMTGEIREVSP